LKYIRDTIADLPYDKLLPRPGRVRRTPRRWWTACSARRRKFGLSQIIGWFDQGAMLPRAEVEARDARLRRAGDAEARLTPRRMFGHGTSPNRAESRFGGGRSFERSCHVRKVARGMPLAR